MYKHDGPGTLREISCLERMCCVMAKFRAEFILCRCTMVEIDNRSAAYTANFKKHRMPIKRKVSDSML